MLGSLIRFFSGAALGATTGAAAAALLTPRSADQIKSELRAYIQEIKDAGAEAEALRRVELEAKFRRVKIL